MNKKFRLRSTLDIKRVRKTGRSIAHPLLVIVYSPNNLTHPRIGVSTSRRVGGAVQRNRAKRVIREGIRPFVSNLKDNLDIVILSRKPILNCKSQEVEAAIKQTLLRGNLLKNEN